MSDQEVRANNTWCAGLVGVIKRIDGYWVERSQIWRPWICGLHARGNQFFKGGESVTVVPLL